MGCFNSKPNNSDKMETIAVKVEPGDNSRMNQPKKLVDPVSPLSEELPVDNGNGFQTINSSEYHNQVSHNQVSPTPSDYQSFTRTQSDPETPEFLLKVFKFRELSRATGAFKVDVLLGKGGFGEVYKGWIKDLGARTDGVPGATAELMPVAVKRLNPNSFQGQQEWLSEIIILGKLHHSSLVRLYGYCADNNEAILVYDFLSNGSLDYHLFTDPNANPPQPVLSWEVRLKIALDAAMGLEHLHNNNVIHRDFKAPNILLDEHWNAKLTDFGLAKVANADQTHITTNIMGTLGYLDPKYMETGELTKKSDVYAFGVLLLELLTGRKAVDPDAQGAPPLTTWAHPYLVARRPDIFALVDPQLHDQFQQKAAQRAAHKLAISAKHCIEEDPTLRPVMKDMVETLRPLVNASAEVNMKHYLGKISSL